MAMKMKSTPASRQRALILLSAWNSGDLPRLRDTLMQDWVAGAPGGWPLTGDDEHESMEMLVTIADAMRNWLRRGGEAPREELQVSMRLLRHLAGSEPLWSENRV